MHEGGDDNATAILRQRNERDVLGVLLRSLRVAGP